MAVQGKVCMDAKQHARMKDDLSVVLRTQPAEYKIRANDSDRLHLVKKWEKRARRNKQKRDAMRQINDAYDEFEMYGITN